MKQMYLSIFRCATVLLALICASQLGDAQPKIAQATETVEVLASSAILQTDKADVHSEISSQQVVELPYSGGEGKNFQSLLYLVPGAGIPATREANSEAGNPQRAQ